MSNQITFKRGDTLVFYNTTAMTITGPSGTTTDFTGWTGTSQIRERDGTVVATLTFSWVDAATGFWQVESNTDTADWPIGKLITDVQFVSPAGQKTSTGTLYVKVVDEATVES